VNSDTGGKEDELLVWVAFSSLFNTSTLTHVLSDRPPVTSIVVHHDHIAAAEMMQKIGGIDTCREMV
jgi:hypothetical protein